MSDFHRHSSWGNTRRPKNITGTDGTAVTDQAALPTEVDVSKAIQAATKSGSVMTLTIANDTVVSAGDVIHISGNASLKNRSFIVATKPNNTTITVDLPQDLKNITPVAGGTIRRRTTAGYSTENQRFLHLITGDGTVVNVWAYSYATGIWAELKLFAREVKTQSGVGADDADTNVETPITLTAGTHRVVEIAGIDRIALNITATVYAATSTF
jgi:hypothetical protein